MDYLEAEGVAELVTKTRDSSTVDIVNQRREVPTALTSIVINMYINCMRKRESTKLLIKTEAQIIGAIRPIAKGITDHLKSYVDESSLLTITVSEN